MYWWLNITHSSPPADASTAEPLWTTQSAPVLFVHQHRLLVKAQRLTKLSETWQLTLLSGVSSYFFFFHPYHSRLVGDEAAGGCDVKKGVDGTGLSSSVLHYCMCAGKVD